MRRALLAALALLLAFGATTWWALEWSGVARLETRAGGATRTTHVWYVERHGELWLEAGTPENAWYRDVLAEPELTLEIEGRRRRVAAEPEAGEEAHFRIRSWMRERYGLRERHLAPRAPPR